MCGHCVGLTCTNAFDTDMVKTKIALIRQVKRLRMLYNNTDAILNIHYFLL